MTALINFLLLLGTFGLLPLAILWLVRYVAKKRGIGLDERYQAQDPKQEPDYRRWQGRRNR
jgi:hypothetical protein